MAQVHSARCLSKGEEAEGGMLASEGGGRGVKRGKALGG